jgi:hypothetical protein
VPGESARINGRKGGRPKGSQSASQHGNTLDKVLAREHLRKLVISRLEPLVEAQMRAAEGLKVAVVRRPDGTFRRIDSPEALDQAIADGDPMDIHTLQPSTQAFTDLMNRALDKPVDAVTVEHSGGIDIGWKGKRP